MQAVTSTSRQGDAAMTSTEDVTIVTLAERPDLLPILSPLVSSVWAEFMKHDAVSNRVWNRLYTTFADFQYLLMDADGTPLAACNSIPVVWDGDPNSLPETGWDWALGGGVEAFDSGMTANTLSAIGIQIDPAQRSRGLSTIALKAMKDIAARHGFRALIAPVRPTLKHLYLLTSIDRYVKWTNDKGELFDPWLRVHARLGATLIRPCHQSMHISGTVAEWAEWTGMAFPESGRYIVPTALEPVDIDVEANHGVYVEPNVWMIHPVDTPV
jgi:hypothetical protein